MSRVGRERQGHGKKRAFAGGVRGERHADALMRALPDVKSRGLEAVAVGRSVIGKTESTCFCFLAKI
jgi:hypothetical protein